MSKRKGIEGCIFADIPPHADRKLPVKDEDLTLEHVMVYAPKTFQEQKE